MVSSNKPERLKRMTIDDVGVTFVVHTVQRMQDKERPLVSIIVNAAVANNCKPRCIRIVSATP